MAKSNIWIILGIVAVLGALFYFKPFGTDIFAVTGSETMTRTLPTSVEKGATFAATYNIIGASGLFGVSVVDTVSGGCTPVGEHKFVIADDYQFVQSQSFTYTAPTTTGTCTFTGDYKFGSYPIKTFTTQTVNIICTPAWTT